MVREEDGRLVLWAPGPRTLDFTAAELSFFAVESSAAELSFFAVEGCVPRKGIDVLYEVREDFIEALAEDGDAPEAVNEAKEAEPSVDSGFVDFRPTSRSNPGGPSDTVVPLRVVDFRPTEVVDSVLVDFRPTPRSNPGGSSEKRRGLEEVVKEVPDDRTLDRASVCGGVLIGGDIGEVFEGLVDFRPARGLGAVREDFALRDNLEGEGEVIGEVFEGLVDFRPARGLELGAVREDFAMRDNLEGEREVIDEAFEGLTIGGDNLALVNLEDLRPESHA